MSCAAGVTSVDDTRGVERLRPGTRVWFAFFVAWMTGLVALALWLLAQYEQGGNGLALRGWVLALMCFYLSLCNSFVPLPTAWIVLLAAAPGYALLPNAMLNVLLVAALGTLATVLANLNEYHLLAYVLRFGLGRRLRQTHIVLWAVRWFERAPFQILTLVAFLPLPIDAVRWLAVLRGYPRRRFALAYLVGRGPRYLLFAGCAVLLELSPWQIIAIQAGIVGLALLGRLAWRLGQRRSVSPDGAQTTLAAAGATPDAPS